MKKNRSMLGVTAAVLLALVGGLLLWQSSDNDESEAAEQAPPDLVQVLVSARSIDQGVSASEMSDNAFAFVKLESIPADQALSDVLKSVDDLGDLAVGRNIVRLDITSGVQLTLSDFSVPGSASRSALPDVDENLFEMTIALEPQRALGGSVDVGENVAIVASFSDGEIAAFDDEGDGGGNTEVEVDRVDSQEPERTTSVVVESVIVTNVQSEQVFTESQLNSDPFAPTLVTTSRLFVTVGVKVADLEKLTFAAEFGELWLARQGPLATVTDSKVHVIEDVSTSLGDGSNESLGENLIDSDAQAEEPRAGAGEG